MAPIWAKVAPSLGNEMMGSQAFLPIHPFTSPIRQQHGDCTAFGWLSDDPLRATIHWRTVSEGFPPSPIIIFSPHFQDGLRPTQPLGPGGAHLPGNQGAFGANIGNN